MSRFEYKITNSVLEIWDKENPNELNAPFLRQPQWPDGTAWANEEEIQAWAEAAITSYENAESEFIPGTNPENPVVVRVITPPLNPDKE